MINAVLGSFPSTYDLYLVENMKYYCQAAATEFILYFSHQLSLLLK